jgi:hypothetical protein
MKEPRPTWRASDSPIRRLTPTSGRWPSPASGWRLERHHSAHGSLAPRYRCWRGPPVASEAVPCRSPPVVRAAAPWGLLSASLLEGQRKRRLIRLRRRCRDRGEPRPRVRAAPRRDQRLGPLGRRLRAPLVRRGDRRISRHPRPVEPSSTVFHRAHHLSFNRPCPASSTGPLSSCTVLVYLYSRE